GRLERVFGERGQREQRQGEECKDVSHGASVSVGPGRTSATVMRLRLSVTMYQSFPSRNVSRSASTIADDPPDIPPQFANLPLTCRGWFFYGGARVSQNSHDANFSHR